MPSFYAQHKEDQWISENISLPDKGFYVDIGCAHPTSTSNTAFLRDLGWQGLAVDGNRNWERDWDNYPGVFRCAIVSEKSQVRFDENGAEPWLSRITPNGTENLRFATPVNILLQAHQVGKIDFLSVDAEGSEFDILAALDFRRHDPSIVIAEYNTRDIGVDHRIHPLMSEKGYELRFANPVNMIFTK